jgi:tetratricopeptide (TPR) repeat protein
MKGLPRWTAVAVATLTAVAVTSAAQNGGRSDAVALRAKGLDLGYNLDHADALAAFRAAVAAEPGQPAAYRSIAATMWISLLFEQGAVTAEDFLGRTGSPMGRKPPSPEFAKNFHDALNRAIAISEERLKSGRSKERPLQPHDEADALYQLGAAYGFQASYTATIEGSLRRSLGPAKSAYNAHERVLQLDPSRKDAGLIVGLYRYMVATMPMWSRMLAYVAGFGGDRERGIRMIEEAAAFPSDVQPNARFSLIVIYNREKRYDDALRVIGDLQRQFPRNRLLWLEAGSTALRANRPLDAVRAYERGLAMLSTDRRPRAFGEAARWHYDYGAALAAAGDARAERELRAALEGDSHDGLRGRVHLELGKLTTDRTRAADEFYVAANLCGAVNDVECVKDAAARLRKVRRQ